MKAKAKNGKTYYKVVRIWEEGDAAVSVYANGNAQRRYAVGKTTRPIPGTGILAFKTLDAAKGFAAKSGTGSAILCGTGRERKLGRPWAGSFYDTVGMRKMWKKRCSYYYAWPRNTVALSWFRPQDMVVGRRPDLDLEW